MWNELKIYHISIAPDADGAAFEELMRTKVLPSVPVGTQTRAGIITAQYLVRRRGAGPQKEYAWMIEWREQGGSIFGGEGDRFDPSQQLTAFGATTSFSDFVLIAEERSTV